MFVRRHFFFLKNRIEIISDSNIHNGPSVLWRSEHATPSQPLHAGTVTEVSWGTDRASRVGGLLSVQPEYTFMSASAVYRNQNLSYRKPSGMSWRLDCPSCKTE